MDKEVVEKDGLKKELSFFSALTVVMGSVIGAGVFFKAEAVFQATGTATLGLLAWVIAGIITICGGLTVSELSAAMPQTGGMVIYLRRAFGELIGYLFGWVQMIVTFPATIAAQAIIFGTQFTNLFNLDPDYIVIVAIIATVFITGINLLGAKAGGSLQDFTMIAKMIPIVLIIIFGFLHDGDVTVSLIPATKEGYPLVTSLGSGIVATMFAYEGWHLVGNIAGELKSPEKDLPRAIIVGLLGVTAIYFLINLAFVMVMTPEQLAATPTPAADVAGILFGDLGGRIITIGILVSVFGGMNGFTLTGIRVPYAMALNNELPFSDKLAKLNKNGVPVVGAIIILLVTIVMILSGQFNQLTDMLIMVVWIFYTLSFVAVFVLRKKEPDMPRPYKTIGYPIVPIIAILGGAYIVINTIVTQPMNSAVGLGLTLLGLPLYFIANKKR